VPILDNGIVGDMITARAWGNFRERWRFDGGLGRWDLNDGNARHAADASVYYAWHVGRHTAEAGYALRWLDWEENRNNGYFDPQNLTANVAVGRASGPIRSKGYYDATVEAGFQSFHDPGWPDPPVPPNDVSNDFFVSVYATAGTLLKDSLRLEGYAGYSTFAQQGGEDYRASRLGIRLRWTFGMRE
jgi:hypothetical protein